MDLAEVNGRVFVNNVSLGLYAEAVQREGYRDAKLRTLLDTVPDVLGPDGGGLDMRWTGPGGHEHHDGCRGARLQQPLPARPRGRLGHPPADRRRPARDHGRRRADRRGEEGRSVQRPWREWSAPTFEVDSDGPSPPGIDGEALVLDAAAEIPHPARSPARAHRPQAPGRLAVGDGSRRRVGRRARAGADRPRRETRTTQPDPRRPEWT